MTLAAIALVGLVNGLQTEGQAPWRILVWFGVPVAAYLHGRHLPVLRAWLVLAAVTASGAGIALLEFSEGVTALLCLGAFVVLPWLVGRFRRQQAELIEMQRERLTRLEREQELTAERARSRERTRIGADIHDTVGHELALIALRAGALEVSRGLNAADREAVAQLRSSAVSATDRLRETIAALRTQDTIPVEPPDEPIEVLVRRAREAGMAVDLTDPDVTVDLAPVVRRAAHRVVQEALTNAARHAPDARVEIRVERETDVVVTVSNTAPATAPVPPGGGNGLVGLAERVRLLGGELQAGRAGNAFTLTARIPDPTPDAT